ncbi:hypothetical protein CAMRE0001_0712 [Campylobacter rectus RM3267]|uniref:Uncharacterized protein n=1 Tax=Campylobacter rectus RM3267 TaxID=553218 RepID=B9CZM2_CAMRE|nr:hypothetical protein CAMRE0001_0712 [Campylobacter rectus RM3267]
MKFTHCKINFLGGKILKFRRNFTASFALLRFCATPQTLFDLHPPSLLKKISEAYLI